VRNVSIPNGVQLSPSYYAFLPNSPFAAKTVASAAGAVVVFDCDYAPVADNVRTRPPEVSHIHISNVKVGNVQSQSGKYSCYQAIVILGPVASDYNGRLPMPAVLPVTNVHLENCDFGNVVHQSQPMFLYNVKGLQLKDVKVDGKVFNQTIDI
jgi:polygalacturonase